jgi:DNA-binding response OmpR family regulator
MSEGQPVRKALLVEDEALVAMLAEDYLHAVGYDPLSVDTAAAALDALRGGGFSLAVIDVGLPDMRGDDLVTMARGLAPGLPIVLASGYDPGDLRARFGPDEGIEVLGKPYTESELRAAVAAATAGAFART